MFIRTIKLPPRRRLAAVGGVVVFVCALVLAVTAMGGGPTAAAGNSFSRKGGAGAEQTVSPKGIRTAEDRLAYLEAYGWLVSKEPLAVEELLIPKEMGEEYADYLALQSSQGFDLAKYAGQTAKRYTYQILNYPTGEQGVQVSLLICKNTVIAADVLSPALNGFMHGLARPDAPAAT